MTKCRTAIKGQFSSKFSASITQMVFHHHPEILFAYLFCQEFLLCVCGFSLHRYFYNFFQFKWKLTNRKESWGRCSSSVSNEATGCYSGILQVLWFSFIEHLRKRKLEQHCFLHTRIFSSKIRQFSFIIKLVKNWLFKFSYPKMKRFGRFSNLSQTTKYNFYFFKLFMSI